MSSSLSPENEAFLASIVAKQAYADRNAAIEEAVGLLRRRCELLDSVNNGVRQLGEGNVHRFAPDELDRFLAIVASRENERFAAE